MNKRPNDEKKNSPVKKKKTIYEYPTINRNVCFQCKSSNLNRIGDRCTSCGYGFTDFSNCKLGCGFGYGSPFTKCPHCI